MTYHKNDKVRIVPPVESKSRAREGWIGTIDDSLDNRNLIANMINDAPNTLNIIQACPHLLPCGCCEIHNGLLCSQYK